MEGVSYEAGVARRHERRSASSSTSTTTTTSRSTARRRSRSPRIARSGSRRSAGTCSTVDDVERPRRAARGDRERAGGDRRGRRSSSSARTSPSARRTRSTPRRRTASPLGDDEVAATKKALGWDPDKHFFVPDEVARAHEPASSAAASSRPSGSARFARWSEAFPGDARDVGRRVGRAASASGQLPEFEAGEELATRDAGKKVMQAFKDAVPTMIGGAADLVESTKTEFEGGGLFSDSWVGPQHRVRHPRARDGLDRQRHRGARRLREAVRLDVPDLQRLHAPGGAALGADGAAGRLGVDARLGRARRGRADAPAGRDVRGAARDPEPLVRAAGRRERDGRARGRSRSSGRTGRSRSRSRGRRCRRSTAPSSRRRPGSSAARTRSGSRRLARPDPDRDRRRGRARARGGPQARRATAPRCASSRCRAGSSSRSSRPTTATRCCRPT